LELASELPGAGSSSPQLYVTTRGHQTSGAAARNETAPLPIDRINAAFGSRSFRSMESVAPSGRSVEGHRVPGVTRIKNRVALYHELPPAVSLAQRVAKVSS